MLEELGRLLLKGKVEQTQLAKECQEKACHVAAAAAVMGQPSWCESKHY